MIELNATKREINGKAVKRLRAEGKVPAVLYGHGLKPSSIFVLYNPFKKVLKEAGESTLVDLLVDGDKHKVLIQDIQFNPLTGVIDHIDFREVKMTEKLEADIILHFFGESRALKELGGVLLKNLSSVKVRCLPQYLVHSIEVSLEPLKNFGDAIHISDIVVPEGIEILANPKEAVMTVLAPREEEVIAVSAEVDLSAIKTVGEEKKAAKEAEKASEKAAEDKK